MPDSPQLIFDSWEEEVITWGQIRRVRWVSKQVDVVLSDAGQGRDGGVAGGIVVMHDEWPFPPS